MQKRGWMGHAVLHAHIRLVCGICHAGQPARRPVMLRDHVLEPRSLVLQKVHLVTSEGAALGLLVSKNCREKTVCSLGCRRGIEPVRGVNHREFVSIHGVGAEKWRVQRPPETCTACAIS